MQKTACTSCVTRFRTCFSNDHSCHGKFCKEHSVIQVSFPAHFMLDGNCGIDYFDFKIINFKNNYFNFDFEIILIDKGPNKK